MKLKVLKPHYYEGKYRVVGSIYVTDRLFGTSAVRRGLCSAMKLPTRADKIKEIEDKKHPKTKKKAIQRKRKK